MIEPIIFICLKAHLSEYIKTIHINLIKSKKPAYAIKSRVLKQNSPYILNIINATSKSSEKIIRKSIEAHACAYRMPFITRHGDMYYGYECGCDIVSFKNIKEYNLESTLDLYYSMQLDRLLEN